ncbi:MAG: transglutaminase family protein [Burkholderiaceae bacterium]
MMIRWTDFSTVTDDFADSVLGLYLGGQSRDVFRQGSVRTLLPDTGLVVPADSLVVVLQGQLHGDACWWGPGNHLPEAPGQLRSGAVGVRVWTCSGQVRGAEIVQRALHVALQAELAARSAFCAEPVAHPCNHDHPRILDAAARLRDVDAEASANAVFRHVQRMPYRFGAWQERASDTLLKGMGVCTAKAQLQVALWRALGLEAGFVEIDLPMDVLSLLMPAGWVPLMRSRAKHYCAAVKLGRRWHVADASFSSEALQLFVERDPALAPHAVLQFACGQPYHPVAGITGRDPFDVRVLPDLHEVLRKRSRFGPHHFEALNTRLDRAQGLHRIWLRAAQPTGQLGMADLDAEGRPGSTPTDVNMKAPGSGVRQA